MNRTTRYIRSGIALAILFTAGTLCAQLSIISVAPNSAEPGTTGLTVTFTIPDTTHPTPPSQVQPTSVTIGTISGASISRPSMDTVTAVFDIPAGEAEGAKDCEITFPGPNGDVSLTKSGGFTVGSGGISGGEDLGNGPPASGYNLFNPMTSKTAYLMDNDKNIIRSWTSSYNPGLALYLLDDGSLLRNATTESTDFDEGGAAGRVELFDWDGNLIWEFEHDSTTHVRQDGTGSAAVYVCFGRATGYWNNTWDDVHGPGAQRSDSKTYDASGYTYVSDGWYFTQSPQGDASRWYNYVRLVRDDTSGIDSDDDGMSDDNEIYAGSDPRNVSSLLTLSLSGVSGSASTIVWPSATGRSCLLQGRADLTEGDWEDVATYSNTAPINAVSHDSGESSYFYRVQVIKD